MATQQGFAAIFLAIGMATAGTAATADSPKPNPCAVSHKGVFYANNFSYLNEPNARCCLGDCLKLMPVAGGGWGTLDVGG